MDDIPFDVEYDDASSTLVVRGCVDELNISAFRQALREATKDYTTSVVVDLNEVTFMPSMAIGVLIGAMARAPGTHIHAADNTPAHQVLKLLGLHEYAATGRKVTGNTA